MGVQNYNRENVNVLHFQGRSDVMSGFFNTQIQEHLEKDISCPEDFTVLTVYTDISKAPLVSQLMSNNIPFVNAYKEEYGEFQMPNKIDYIIAALKEIKTKYVLILDAYDVLIQDFDDIIERFESYNTRMLFNASKNNFPVLTVDKMMCRDYIGSFNHFNAGCAIGYTKDFIDFYTDCLLLKNSEDFSNPYNSEQYVLRHVFAKYSEQILSKSPYICIDYKCKIFVALSQAWVTRKDSNHPWVAV